MRIRISSLWTLNQSDLTIEHTIISALYYSLLCIGYYAICNCYSLLYIGCNAICNCYSLLYIGCTAITIAIAYCI